jgi:hypothetical protein
MADLKPLGSEKLQGMDKINRILQIARYNESPIVESDNSKTLNYSIVLSDGKTYGIVKERQGYIIKSGLNESTLDYNDNIKNRKYYRSYSDAMKKLNLMTKEINSITGYEHNIPLIGEQEGQKKKFVLKTKKPTTDVPAEPVADVPAEPTAIPSEPAPATPPTGDMAMPTTPEPAPATPPTGDMEMPADPSVDMEEPTTPEEGGVEPEQGLETGIEPGISDEEGEEGEEPTGPTGLKTIQKLTGRLSQKIRSFDKEKGLDSQDIKYVVNSILSAIDLSKLDDEDRDEILDKLEEYDEYGQEGEGELDLSGDEDLDLPTGDEEEGMSEEEPMNSEEMSPVAESKVEKILEKYFKIEKDEKPILEEKIKKDFIKNKLNTIKIKSEIESLSESIVQKLKSFKLMERNDAKFVGKTNKENLIFIVNGKQVKVTPRGQVI